MRIRTRCIAAMLLVAAPVGNQPGFMTLQQR